MHHPWPRWYHHVTNYEVYPRAGEPTPSSIPMKRGRFQVKTSQVCVGIGVSQFWCTFALAVTCVIVRAVLCWCRCSFVFVLMCVCVAVVLSLYWYLSVLV